MAHCIIEAFSSTFRYLNGLLNIDIPYFEGMVNQIYPPKLQLNKANTSDTLDLHLSILTQTPNATRNEAEFDRSRFSRRTKMTSTSQKQPVNILKPLVFVCR